MLVQLALNGVEIKASESEIIALGLSIACGESTFDEVARWIEAHATHDQEQ